MTFIAAASAAAWAQPPRATVTPHVETSPAAAGSVTRVALAVELPEKLHVQSDKPRDPLLIPTVLTIDPPAGVKVTTLIFPHPTDFKLEGQAEPLAVFENKFAVGAELELGPGVPAGPLVIPGRLRYQACDDKVCFQPRTERVEWALNVAPSGSAVTRSTHQVFAQLSAGRRTGPPAV